MESTQKTGLTFSANVQYNAQRKGLELLFERKRLFPPKKISNIELTEQERNALHKGRSVFVKNLTDKQGRKYDAYITWSNKNGRLNFSSKNPNDDTVKKVATPGHKVQVAANNDGHKPEALKNVKGAVKQKQPDTPTSKQTAKRKQNKKQPVTKQKQKKVAAPPKKNKGMKM